MTLMAGAGFAAFAHVHNVFPWQIITPSPLSIVKKYSRMAGSVLAVGMRRQPRDATRTDVA